MISEAAVNKSLYERGLFIAQVQRSYKFVIKMGQISIILIERVQHGNKMHWPFDFAFLCLSLRAAVSPL